MPTVGRCVSTEFETYSTREGNNFRGNNFKRFPARHWLARVGRVFFRIDKVCVSAVRECEIRGGKQKKNVEKKSE